ncbi:hypothetical protein [Nitrospira sp. Ecomares 2.1]
MISSDQIRAWLTTAFGSLLSGIALTPVSDTQFRKLVVQEVTKRISMIDSLPSTELSTDVMDHGCGTLYNTHSTPDGLQTTIVRQGQGQEWQNHWAWLSVPQDVGAMKATLSLAGLLLINEPLLMGLISTVRSGEKRPRKRALCVMRRWLLTTKVLAWLIGALEHNWTTVRPQDLACFAFSALSPAWPRRAVAISHRSSESKPVLSTLNMWSSPHAAIDASFVPAWETNTGMIWSLFAAVPLIARVESPAYFESEWCRREHEMIQYLLECADFYEERTIVDIGVDQLAELDVSLYEKGEKAGSSLRKKPETAPRYEFPPFSLVLVATLPMMIDLALLRAAGALRLIHALVQNPSLANEVAGNAAAGNDIDIEAPTNNPDGWVAYGDIFRDLETLLGREEPKQYMVRMRQSRKDKHSLSLLLPDDYSALDIQLDHVSAGQIPDLSGGKYVLADVLAALEWRRTVLTWFLDQGYGDKVLVNISGINAEEWTTLPDMSLARGLLSLYSDSPIWIMQRADQNAHLWPGFREQPIFTRYLEEQFSWIKPVVLNSSWLLYYLANSGLDIESKLEAAMIGAVVHSEGPEAVKIEPQSEGMGLIIPEPKSFFMIPIDALQSEIDSMAGHIELPHSWRAPNPGPSS